MQGFILSMISFFIGSFLLLRLFSPWAKTYWRKDLIIALIQALVFTIILVSLPNNNNTNNFSSIISALGKNTANVNLTENEVKEILKKLTPKAINIYGMFNGSGYFKSDATKTIPGEKGYNLVISENFKSIADLKKAVEDVFTKDCAQKVFYSRYLTPDKDRPLYKDYEGQIYQDTNNGGHGWATKFFVDTAKIKSQKDNVVEVELDTTVFDKPADKVTISIEYVNGKWLLASGLNNE